MYDVASTIMIQSPVGETSEFPIIVRLHQEFALSPYLFALVIDKLTRQILDDVPCCMLFVDEIVLVDEIAKRINAKLEIWRKALGCKIISRQYIQKVLR